MHRASYAMVQSYPPMPQLILSGIHSAPLTAVAICEQKHLIATGSVDLSVIAWCLRTGAPIGTFLGHKGYPRALCFSRCGSMIASVGEGELRVWKVASGRLIRALEDVDPPVCFLENSPTICARSGSGVSYVALSSGEVIKHFPAGELYEDSLSMAALSSDYSSLAMASIASEVIAVFDFNSERFEYLSIRNFLPEREDYLGRLDTFAIGPGAAKIGLVYGTGIYIIDRRTGSFSTAALDSDKPSCLAFSPDGSVLFAGTLEGEVHAFSDLGTRRWSHWIHRLHATGLALSGSLGIGASCGHDRRAVVWSQDEGRRIQVLEGIPELAEADYSPEQEAIVAGYRDGSVRVWCLKTGVLKSAIHLQNTAIHACVVTTANGAVLSEHFGEGKVGALARLRIDRSRHGFTHEVIRTFKSTPVRMVPASSEVLLLEAREIITGVMGPGAETIFEIPGRVLAVSSRGIFASAAGWLPGVEVELRSVSDGRLLKVITMRGISSPIVSLAFSPDGELLVCGSMGFELCTYDLSKGSMGRTRVSQLESPVCTTFSPDGALLAVGGAYNGVIELYRVNGGRLRLIKRLRGGGAGTCSLHFVGERRLVVGNTDGGLRIWDVKELELRATLVGFPQAPEATTERWVAFTPAGNFVGSPGIERVLSWRGRRQRLGRGRGIARSSVAVAEALS